MVRAEVRDRCSNATRTPTGVVLHLRYDVPPAVCSPASCRAPIHPPADRVEVPGGAYRIGSTASLDEQPITEVRLSTFLIDVGPVTERRVRALPSGRRLRESPPLDRSRVAVHR